MATGFFNAPNRVWLILLMALPLLGVCSALGQDGDTISRSLVRIHVTQQTPDYRAPWNPGWVSRGTGSGFVISGGRIITNAHVVSNAAFLGVQKNGDPKLFEARVQHIAHDCDLALLSVEEPGFFEGTAALEIGGLPKLNSMVAVFGYPVGGERMSVTRGVVSRTEFRPYSHSGLDAHLAVQIDAAVNPGNSGGPVIQDGKVVGVAFQGFSGAVAQNTAYMIPTPVLLRMLTDVRDGRYDGYVELAVDCFNLQNPAYRAALGLPDDNRGVVVTGVLRAGSGHGAIRRRDVLLSIDGHPITSDGHIVLDGEYVQLEEIVERKFHGDTVVFGLLRDGRAEEVTVTLKGAEPYRILARSYDVRPRFVLFAGLLFQPMEHNLVGTYGSGNPELKYHYDFWVSKELYLQRPEVVVLSQTLPDPINTYLRGFELSIVDEVNGSKIQTLRDLDRAFSVPADRYVIRVLGQELPIVLESAQLEEANARIARQYHVTASKHLGPEQ